MTSSAATRRAPTETNRDKGGKQQSGKGGSGKSSGQSKSPRAYPIQKITSSFSEAFKGAMAKMAMVAFLAIAAVLVLLAVLKIFGGLGGYRGSMRIGSSGLFRQLARLLGLAGKLKPRIPKLKFKKRLRIKVKDRSKLASYRFRNPFRDKQLGSRLSPVELVQYSYDALTAFASDAGFPKEESQTPYEFAETLPEELPRLAKPTEYLTEMAVRAEYAPKSVTGEDVNNLRNFWRAYETAISKVFR
ncbi:DUF4129 domain-containing protein [Candidatus Hydrogenedentota bacterium]